MFSHVLGKVGGGSWTGCLLCHPEAMQQRGTLTVTIEGRTRTFALTERPYRIGREEGSEIPLRPAWVSRRQASVQVRADGALVMNLSRQVMRATSDVLNATVERGGTAWATLGETLNLAWPDLPHPLTCTLAVWSPAMARTADELPRRRRPLPWGLGAGTVLPASPGRSTSPLQDHRMAVLFQHLLLHEDRPTALYETAAAELGITVGALKQSVRRIMVQVNADRDQPLTDIDALGRYLVASRMLTMSDLEPPGGA
jgi:hypothetical protein